MNSYEINQEPQQQSNRYRLFKGLGNITEFGSYFAGGLLLGLICRLMPKLLMFYLLLKLAVVGYLWLSHGDQLPHVKRSLRLIGLAIALSSIGVMWDGMAQLLLLASGWHLLAIAALIIALVRVVVEVLRYKEGR